MVEDFKLRSKKVRRYKRNDKIKECPEIYERGCHKCGGYPWVKVKDVIMCRECYNKKFGKPNNF